MVLPECILMVKHGLPCVSINGKIWFVHNEFEHFWILVNLDDGFMVVRIFCAKMWSVDEDLSIGMMSMECNFITSSRWFLL